MPRFSQNTRCRFLFFCVLAIFCFCRTSAAQSGRRINKNTAPSAPVAQKTPVESKPVETVNDVPKNDASVKISALAVVGEVQHNFDYYKSNEIDAALKECIRTLQYSPKSLTQIAKGSGKTSYKDAKELAEKEADVFVLWLGFSAKNDQYGKMYIDSLQYALLTPQTAKVITRGEITPKQNGVLSTGGVLNIPNGRNTTSALIQMKDGAREIAGILLRGGWIK